MTSKKTKEILELAKNLSIKDRKLIRSLHQDGITASELARKSGIPAQRLRRHHKRLINRMKNPIFHYVLNNKQHWNKNRRRVAEMLFLQGFGQRTVATALNMSLHNVRQHATSVLALYEHS